MVKLVALTFYFDLVLPIYFIKSLFFDLSNNPNVTDLSKYVPVFSFKDFR